MQSENTGRRGSFIEAARRAETTPTAKLAAYARSYLGHAASNREAMIAAIEIVISHRNADGVPLYLIEGENDTAALRSILSTGTASGEFRAADLDVVTATNRARARRRADSVTEAARTRPHRVGGATRPAAAGGAATRKDRRARYAVGCGNNNRVGVAVERNREEG